MSRTMIDLDDEMVEHAMRLYGVKTKAKAVRMAIEEAVKRRLRQEGIDAIKSGDLDLAYDSRMELGGRDAA